jgi:hypothetical protein
MCTYLFRDISLTLYTGQCDRRKNASYPATTESNRSLMGIKSVFRLQPTYFLRFRNCMSNCDQYYKAVSNGNADMKYVEEI